MKFFNLVYKIKKEKNCEKRSGGLSVNDICFNIIKFLKLLPSCKSVNPLQRSYLKYFVFVIDCLNACCDLQTGVCCQLHNRFWGKDGV